MFLFGISEWPFFIYSDKFIYYLLLYIPFFIKLIFFFFFFLFFYEHITHSFSTTYLFHNNKDQKEFPKQLTDQETIPALPEPIKEFLGFLFFSNASIWKTEAGVSFCEGRGSVSLIVT